MSQLIVENMDWFIFKILQTYFRLSPVHRTEWRYCGKCSMFAREQCRSNQQCRLFLVVVECYCHKHVHSPTAEISWTQRAYTNAQRYKTGYVHTNNTRLIQKLTTQTQNS